jgi:hypothetical protein
VKSGFEGIPVVWEDLQVDAYWGEGTLMVISDVIQDKLKILFGTLQRVEELRGSNVENCRGLIDCFVQEINRR